MHIVIAEYLAKRYSHSCKEERAVIRKIRAALRWRYDAKFRASKIKSKGDRKAHYQKHREKYLARARERQKNATPEQKARSVKWAKSWKERNPERVKELERRSRKSNPERQRAKQRHWYQKHKEVIRARQQKARANLTTEQIEKYDNTRRKLCKKHIDELDDNYIKSSLRRIFRYSAPGQKVEITPELVQLKRQQLKLWRMAYDEK